MWKVFIADDEPKIRKGLKKLVESFSEQFRVSAEAEDGQTALEYVSAELPDIMLVDICMPRLNGLDFIEKIREKSVNSIIIIVTGHDEFELARRAVELPVFDYVLKPVDHRQLAVVMEKAASELEKRRNKNDLLKWAEKNLSSHRPRLFQEFMEEWLACEMSCEEFEQRRAFLSLQVSSEVSLIGIRVEERFIGVTLQDFKENKISRMAALRLLDQNFEEFGPFLHFTDQQENLYYVLKKICPAEFCTLIKRKIKEQLNLHTYCECIRCTFDYEEFPNQYEKIRMQLENYNHARPFMRKLSLFLEETYMDQDLSLDKAASYMAMSTGYVTRLLKQHTGYSFTEFTNRFRICKAINLLSNPEKKIFEIADAVGYSSQHYFSRTFKRVTGMSPEDFRREPGGSS